MANPFMNIFVPYHGKANDTLVKVYIMLVPKNENKQAVVRRYNLRYNMGIT